MSQVQEVKAASDIVQVIGERVTLQRSGSSWRGLCPFHGERSPSFFVNEQFQRYKCFGCGESGDVFSFLEKYDGMTFAEALQHLAERAGITLTSYAPTTQDEQRQRLRAILHLAKEYYHYVLTQHPAGEPAREYLKQRGVTQESIKIFQMGYAMPSWDGLVQYLHHKKKHSLPDLVAAGLVVSNQSGRTYDRFRDRIMFPLTDHRGQVVGFSGRLLQAAAKEAKYINSPETELYHKGKMLYGFAELYQEIRKKKEVIVAEGEFDVISSTQAHVNNVVAIKGSALTTDHLQLLQRAATRVLFALDADSAGVKATQRAINMTEGGAVEVRIVPLPAGQDPDDLARQQPAEWRQLVKASISAYDFLIQTALKAHGATTPDGRRKILLEVGPYLARIKMSVEQDVYIKKLAALLQVKEELVRSDVMRLGAMAEDKQANASLGAVQRQPQQETEAKPEAIDDRVTRLEEYVIALIAKVGMAETKAYLEKLQQLKWQQPGLQHIADEIVAQLRVEQDDRSAQFQWQKLPDAERSQLFDLLYQPEMAAQLPEEKMSEELKRSLSQLERWHVQAEINVISQELSLLDDKTERTPEEELRQATLLSQIVSLQSKLKPV